MWTALIPAVVSAIGAIAGSKQNRKAAEEANKDRTPPELQRLREGLAAYLEAEGYGPKPYDGQINADVNPVLQAALTGAMQNRNAGSGMLNDLLGRFGSPSGAMGWSPTSSFGNRTMREPVANQGRRTPDAQGNARQGGGRRG